MSSQPSLVASTQPKLTAYIPHCPSAKQGAFLTLNCLEAFYGGAAGGGKSDALLMAALQYVDISEYAALLLRRTYADLALPGALMDRATEWLAGTDAVWSSGTKTWIFPSGATVSFGYLEQENDKLRYQGAELQFIGFDELTQFTESQYLYLFSRLRRLKGVEVPLRMRGASNPGGVGHEWVKARFVSPAIARDRSVSVRDRVFIPARLDDNPYLDQDEYTESLNRLDIVTRKQLLMGDWDVSQEGSIAKREWFPIVDVAPAQATRIRAWDFAATEKAVKAKDPDYTVGMRICTVGGIWYFEDMVRGRYGPGVVEQIVKQVAQLDGRGIQIAFEQEGGSSGKLFAATLIKALAGWTVRAVPVSGDKLQRAMPWLRQAEAGNVRLVRGEWNSAFLGEILSFPAGHDDIIDGVSLGFSQLTQGGWARGPVR